MYHFNFGGCSFYWTLHLESPSTRHTGSPIELQIFTLRLTVFSWTIICICSVLPQQKCRSHIYIHLLQTFQKICVSRDIILNATWLYMFNKQWTLYSKLCSKSTYFKFYGVVLRLKVKIIHSEKRYIISLFLFLPCCFHNLFSSQYCQLSNATEIWRKCMIIHGILLSKLNFYGINGKDLARYQSYMDKRYFRTAIYNDSNNSNKVSSWAKVRKWVPQGFMFGPLLFLLYKNDLSNIINETSAPVIFADDTSIIFAYSNLTDFKKTLTKSLKL